MRNTKEQLLAAYHQVLAEQREKERQQLQPAAARQKKQDQDTIKAIGPVSADAVIQQTTRLKQEVNRILLRVTDGLTAEIDRLEHVQLAIEIKERELKERYAIEHEAAALASLIEAHQRQKELLEQDMGQAQDRLKSEIETQRAQWAEEQQAYEAKLQERQEQDTRARQRAQEEYEYSFAQQRQRAQDRFEAEKEGLDRELQALRDQTERELVLKRHALAQREEKLTALQAQVEAFPQRLEDAVARAIQENTEKLECTNQHQVELQAKENEGQLQVLQTRIQALEKTVKRQREQITKLTKQLDTAFQTNHKLTLKAIEGASQ